MIHNETKPTAADPEGRTSYRLADERDIFAGLVDRTPWLGEGFLSGQHSWQPSERFSGRILAAVSLVGSISNRPSPRPRLRCENSQWISRRRHRKTGMTRESIPRARLQSAKAAAFTGELQRRRVVQDQHVCVFATARRGHRDVWPQDLPKRHVIVVQEPVERLELSFGRYGLGKAPGGFESKPFADALKF